MIETNVKHLANWYFGNFCSKCARIESEKDKYGKECYDKIHLIADKLTESGNEKMIHKEFTGLIRRNSLFCRPIRREFHECRICKAMGVRY